MKQRSLFTIMMCALLWYGHFSHAAAGLAEAGERAASEAAMKSAGEAITKAGIKASAEDLEKMTADLAKSMDKSAESIMAGTAVKDSEAVLKSLEESATQSLKQSSITDFESFSQSFTKNENLFSENMIKDFSGKSDQELKNLGFSDRDISTMKQADRESMEVLGDRSSSMSSSRGSSESSRSSSSSRGSSDATPQPVKDAGIKPTKSLSKEESDAVDKMSKAEKEAFNKLSPEDQEAYFKMNPVEKKNFATTAEREAAEKEAGAYSVKNFGKFIGGGVIGVVEIVAMAVLFMIPSIFESGYLAEQQRNALLTTYSAPIEFGNIVLQIPDSEINVTEPSMSDFIYYGIPVDAAGSHLSASAAELYPGVTGPDKNNSVTKSITHGYAQAASFGMGKIDSSPSRYNLNAQALSTLPMFVSYSENSWDVWGTSAITDPSFNQMLINLNTGMIFYADGQADDTPPAPLVGKGSVKTVESYLSTKLGKLSTSGSTSSFTEYVDTFSSSKSSKTASPITAQFNCACLHKNHDVLSADTLASCSVGGSSNCLLVPTLNTLAAGLIINAQGTQLSKTQDFSAEIAQGALGQVVPIQGMGDSFDDFLSLFPGAEDQALSSTNLTVSYGFLSADGSSQSSSKPKIQGAAPDNYAAQGVYVYQCKNTPLAKMLRSQAGGSVTSSYNDHIFDYIVFFDHELNQVPLMVPMEDPTNFNFPAMKMNPAIEYFSTIIGDTDGNGNFKYLDSLKVVPGKNQPAIIPLYGLKAQGGRFEVNSNAQLESKIGGIVRDLQGHAELGEQFTATCNAFLQLTKQGPFGKYNLRPYLLDGKNPIVINGTQMIVYKGFNAYPVAQDEKATDCNDLLIPIDSQGNTATLPSHDIAGYYGMVSDLSYAVAPDGTFVVSSAAHSCFSQSTNSATGEPVWHIDDSKADQYFWLSNLTSMNNHQEFSSELTNYIHANRKAWINWVKKTNSSEISNVELTGVSWQGSGQGKRKDSILTIVGQQALVNGLYVYTCMPNPSKLPQDFFVLTASLNPAVTDTSLGSMSATKAQATTNMLSLVSGLLYDSSGSPIKNSAGIIYQIDAMTLINNLYSRNTAGFSDEFTTNIVNAYNSYKKSQANFVYPFEFYNLKLGMYQADIDRACYVYADAVGAGTSTDFKPHDYFVTYDDQHGINTNQPLSNDPTQCVVSLVSGIVYNKSGAVHTLNDSQLKALYASVSKVMRSDMKNDLDNAIKLYNDQQKSHAAADQQMQKDADNQVASGVMWKQSDVVAKISAVSTQPYLPAPYVLLKQDPSSKQYVQISPASTDGTDLMYTFFDVPYKNSDGSIIHVAGMFDSKGNQLYLFGDLQLESSLIQNGIAIDANGKQVLGVPGLQPIMLLDKADLNLKPGVTGKSMIHAGHADFPSGGITSPITYQNRTAYFYYNTIMKAYYVMEVSGKDIRYISIAGGNIYNQDGSYRAQINPVGLKNGNDTQDLLLPYLNDNGYTECIMSNFVNNRVYQLFSNIEKSFQGNVKLGSDLVASNLLVATQNPYTQVSVVQMPRLHAIPPMPDIHDAQQYNVYWDVNNPIIYKVDGSYVWQNLSLLPINMQDQNRAMIANNQNSVYQNAAIVLKNNSIDHLIFGNALYEIASCSGSTCTMKQVGNASSVVKVSLQKDPKVCTKDLKTGVLDPSTGVSYYEIVVDGVTYNYQIIFDSLSDEQLSNYQYNMWQSATVADVYGNIVLVPFLPGAGSQNLQLQAVGIGAVSNVPDDSSVQATLTKNLARVKKDAVHGRFLATIYPSGGSDDQGPFFDYFNQNGYVDLQNGTIFDDKGIAVGIALQMGDLVLLLNKLSVTVTYNEQKVAQLSYKTPPRWRAAGSANVNAAQYQAQTLGRLSADVQAEKKDTQADLTVQQIEALKKRLKTLTSGTQEYRDLAQQINEFEKLYAEQVQEQLRKKLGNNQQSLQSDNSSLMEEYQRLLQLKADEDLKKEIEKLKRTLPQTDVDKRATIEDQNRMLRASIDNLQKDIALISRNGNQSEYIQNIVKNKRDTIAEYQERIRKNNLIISDLTSSSEQEIHDMGSLSVKPQESFLSMVFNVIASGISSISWFIFGN